EVPGLTLVLTLNHVVLGGVDDPVGIVGLKFTAVFVEVLDIVAAAVIAVVVDHNGELGVVGHLFAVVGHGDNPGTLRLAGIDDIGEALAVDDIIVGQAAPDIHGAVVPYVDLG